MHTSDMQVEEDEWRAQRTEAVRPRGTPRAAYPCHVVHRPYKRKRVAADYLAFDNKPFKAEQPWKPQDLLQEAESLLDGIFDDFECPDQGLYLASHNPLASAITYSPTPVLIDHNFVSNTKARPSQVKEQPSNAMIVHPRGNKGDQTETNKPFPGQNTQWSDTEETFLVGAVMDHFFGHGSLTPRRKGNKGGTVWCSIKSTFDDWLGRYASVTGATKPQGRSAKALLRHYKSMKGRSTYFYAIYRKFTSSYEGYIRASYKACSASYKAIARS